MSSRQQIPPQVDYLLRWTVLGILIVFFVLPAIFYMTAVMPIHRKVNTVLEHTAETMKRSLSGSNITRGGDPAMLKALEDRLKSLSALSGDAAQFNRTLHVAIVETSTTEPPTISVDLGQAGDAAVLLVTGSSIIWNIENASPRQRAKVSFEGPAVVDVVNAHAGLIGGFRIGALGSRRFAYPRDAMAGAPIKSRWRFCSMLKEWAGYYNVRVSDLYLYHFRDPTRISVFAGDVTAEGSKQIASEIEAGLCDYRGYR